MNDLILQLKDSKLFEWGLLWLHCSCR